MTDHVRPHTLNDMQEIIELEAESHAIDALLDKQRKTLLNWQSLLQAQKDAHVAELEQV